MKKIFLFLFACYLSVGFSFAQFEKYTEIGQRVFSEEGVLYLNEKDSLTGIITYKPLDEPDKINITYGLTVAEKNANLAKGEEYKNDEKKEKTFKSKNFIAFRLLTSKKYFEVKQADEGGLTIDKNTYIMENMSMDILNKSVILYRYYIISDKPPVSQLCKYIKGDKRTEALTTLTQKNAPKHFANCPMLLEKIKNKENGYELPKSTLSLSIGFSKEEHFKNALKIIVENGSCK